MRMNSGKTGSLTTLLLCALGGLAFDANALEPEAIFQRVSPAVWTVKADRGKGVFSIGSAVAVTPAALVTACHVVDGATSAVVSQGTMLLRAERVEVREGADGYRAATAVGSRAKPATWRQRRDGVDETVEGSADRIEFDGRSDTVRFVGNANLRRVRAAGVADEINGGVIVWDNLSEVFKVEGGATSAANPTGRVRVVLSPRAETAASGGGTGAASGAPSRAAPTAPTAPAASGGAPLAPVRQLGERR